MNNKVLITVIFLLLASALVNVFMPFGAPGELFITLSLYLALVVMLFNGTFITRRYAMLAWISIGLYMLGMAFKIMHLTGADQLLTISFPVLAIVYTLHFISKPTKKLLDYLKMLILISLAYIPLTMLRLVPYETQVMLEMLHMAPVGITFAVFLMELWRESKTRDEERPE